MFSKLWGSSKENHSTKPNVKATPDKKKISWQEVGLIENLTQEQSNTLNLLKKKIENREFNNISIECFDDIFLLRYLRARSFDLEKTCTMLQNSLNWRMKMDMTKLTTEEKFDFDKTLNDHYPRAYFGVDKKGRPIYINCIGRVQAKELLNKIGRDQLMRKYLQEYEFCTQIILPACSVAAGKPIEQTVTIIDLDGLSFSILDSTTRGYLGDLLTISQDHYPDTLGEMMIINVPKLFQIIWSFCKQFIDEKTLGKVRLYSRSDPWREELLKYIDVEQLPQFLGGQKYPGNSWMDLIHGPWNDTEILHKVHKMHPYYSRFMFKLAFPDLNEKEFDEFFDFKISKNAMTNPDSSENYKNPYPTIANITTNDYEIRKVDYERLETTRSADTTTNTYYGTDESNNSDITWSSIKRDNKIQ